MAPDGLSRYAFKLRSGVKFQAGSALDGQSVVVIFERLPSNPLSRPPPSTCGNWCQTTPGVTDCTRLPASIDA